MKWNMDTRGYRNGLRATARIPGPIVGPRKKHGEKLEYQAFRLIWRRDGDLSIRTWSNQVSDRHHVTGRIKAIYPTVTVYGNVISDEVSNLLSPDLLLNACSVSNIIRFLQ